MYLFNYYIDFFVQKSLLVQFCPLVQKCLRTTLTRPWEGNKNRAKLTLRAKLSLVRKWPFVQKCLRAKLSARAKIYPCAKVSSCKNEPSSNFVYVQFCVFAQFCPLAQFRQLPLLKVATIQKNSTKLFENISKHKVFW